MTVTGENGEQTLFYLRKDGGGQTPVQVLGGKVIAPHPPSSSID